MKVEVKLETVTPLFLSGADPCGEPELRAASFRGLLRFWGRALVGGVVGDGNLKALREAEKTVFGDIESGSNIIVRVSGQTRSQPFKHSQPGVDYLFWSILRTDRRCFPHGTPFTLTLQTRAGVKSGEPIRMAWAALWLLTHLGGVGSRVRRGGGGVQVIKVKGPVPVDIPDMLIRAQTPQQLNGELSNGLKQLRALVRTDDSTPSIPSANPQFNVLHRNCCRIVVLNKEWANWEQALNDVGLGLQTFRSRRPPDYQNVKNVVSDSSSSLSPVERSAFGLPIGFYYRSLGGKKATLKGSIHDRRASPILIRVVRLANGQYTVVMTVFRAKLLERNEQLALKQGKRVLATASTPNLSLIDAFLSGLGIPLLEVKNW